jgi:hypothetical protein
MFINEDSVTTGFLSQENIEPLRQFQPSFVIYTGYVWMYEWAGKNVRDNDSTVSEICLRGLMIIPRKNSEQPIFRAAF